jgi:hypothetical protein
MFKVEIGQAVICFHQPKAADGRLDGKHPFHLHLTPLLFFPSERTAYGAIFLT